MAITIDEYSLASVYLELRANGHKLGNGTGFTFEYSGKSFLFSNWHVYSGRNPRTGQPEDPNGGIPDEVVAVLPTQTMGSWSPISFRLLDSAGTPTWLQHPSAGQDVDIAALEIQVPATNTHYAINGRKGNPKMLVAVAQDVYVIGFPLGLMAGGALPVWKRASVASEPGVDPNGDKIIYIDTATRAGMSGSPVIARIYGNYVSEGGGMNITSGVHSRFIGVYSGRKGSGEEKAQLGVVWKRELIDELLSGSVRGSYQLRP